MDDLPSRPTFHDVTDQPWELGNLGVLAMPVTHPGPTVGYRLVEEGRDFAYISDHEPALGLDLRTASPERVSGYELARGADVLDLWGRERDGLALSYEGMEVEIE